MKLNRTQLLIAGCALGFSIAAGASAQLRIVTWNVTNYNSNGTAPSNSRDDDFQTAIYGIIPNGLALQGQSMSPDVLVVQEMISQAATTQFRNMLNNAPGSPGDWAAAPFVDGPDTDSAFFYRTSRVQFLGAWAVALGSSSTCNQPRHTMRYDFRPVGYTSAGASIGAYSVHLKAQGSNAACPGGENAEGRRLIECQRIRDNAEGVDTNPNWVPGSGGSNPPGSSALPAGFNFMIVGDTNIQNSTAVDYQEMVGSQVNNAGRVFDPIVRPGNWNNNSAFRFIHTQDPASQMDDRHDQILVSGSLLDRTGLDYIFVPDGLGNPQAFSASTALDPNHTYRAWGNDGGGYNVALRTAGNTFVGPVIAQALITTTASGGHLPIVADFRVPAKAAATASISFGQVLQNSVASQNLTVSNAGNTTLWTVAGIDVLGYSLAASSGFSAPAGQFTDAAGGGTNQHAITMNTATTGIKSGTVTIATNDPDQPTIIVTLSGEVVPSTPTNQPPVARAGNDVLINNFSGSGSEVATLDGSASTDDVGIATYRWSEGPSVLAIGPSPVANVPLSVGTHTIVLACFDGPGLTGADTVIVTINGRPTAAAGGDQTVTDGDNTGSESVLVDGSASIDPEGAIAEYRWSEGPTVLAQSPSPTANLDLAIGVHALTLRVTDPHGNFHEDTVQVTVEPGTPPCLADFNNDGDVNPDDLGDYLNCYFAVPPCPLADFNNDGGVDPDDLGDYLNVFFGPPC